MNSSSSRVITVLLADDHPLVREGIRSRTASNPGIEIVAEAENGLEAVRLAEQIKPDIILMDISMPEMSGLQATRLLLDRRPESRIIILSMHRDRSYVLEVLRAGARGYVLKDSSPRELFSAIEAVHRGDAFFSPAISDVMALELVSRGGAKQPQLSLRETEILVLIAEGLLNKQIAVRLGVSERTIETHREHLCKKLNVHTIAGLTRYAIAHGYAPLQ